MSAPSFVTVDHVLALFDHIEQQLGSPADCDRTLRHAREWSEANGLPWPEIQTWLHSIGAACDCDFLSNRVPHAKAGDV